MKRFLVASVVGLTAATAVSAQDDVASASPGLIPAHFSVCVTTVDADGRARADSSWYLEDEARTRRAEILRLGWIATGDEKDREDFYPPHSIVKATIDPTLENHAFCLAPSADVIVWESDVLEAGAIPAQFAVCVSTMDAKHGRVDSFWSTDVDARNRREEILRDGWLAAGDEPDREDLYPPHSIVKTTIDDVLLDQPACRPPER